LTTEYTVDPNLIASPAAIQSAAAAAPAKKHDESTLDESPDWAQRWKVPKFSGSPKSEDDDEGGDGEEDDEEEEGSAVVENEGMLIQREADGSVKVTHHPSFGLLWPDPTVVGCPGRDATVRIVPYDEVMDVALGDRLDTTKDIFVSRARTRKELADDIQAAYVGTREEYKIFGSCVTIILSTINAADFKTMFHSLGLRDDRVGNLNRLAIYLRYQSGAVVDGTFLTSFTDVQRIREFYARTCVEFKQCGEWTRVMDFGDGDSLQLPYSDWRIRMCMCYSILELDNDALNCPVRTYYVMRWGYFYRAVMLGSMMDFAAQSTIGSERNLEHFGYVRPLLVPLLVLRCYLSNLVWGSSWQCLAFENTNGTIGSGSFDTFDVVNAGTSDTANTLQEGDRWWLEVRALWIGGMSPDLKYPVVAKLGDFYSSKVARFGTAVKLVGTDANFKNRISSLSSRDNGPDFIFRKLDGSLETKKVRWTNPELTTHYVVWSDAFDDAIGERWVMSATYETMSEEIIVPADQQSCAGRFSEFVSFSGFSGL
jgi:hypothetical protein